MAVTEVLTDYDTTAANNTPAGSDAVGSNLDDHLRNMKMNTRFASNWRVQAAKITAYTATISDHASLILVDCSATAVTVTLPAAATAGDGYRIGIKRSSGASDGNACTIDGSGAETIDGDATVTLDQLNEAHMIACDGSGWHILSRSTPSSTLPALGGAGQFLRSNGTSLGYVAGAWERVSGPTTFTTSSQVTVADLDCVNYEHEFLIRQLVGSASNNLLARVSEDNGSSYISTASSYTYANFAWNNTSSPTTGSSSSLEIERATVTTIHKRELRLRLPAMPAGEQPMLFNLLSNYNNGSTTSAQHGVSRYGGTWTGPMDAIEFIPSTGTISGIIEVSRRRVT